MKMATETALVAPTGDADDHRVAKLPARKELQRRGFAANLVLGVVVVGEVLNFRHRKKAQLRRADCHAENALLVEQRVEHAPAPGVSRELCRHAIHAAAFCDVLAEHEHLRVLGKHVVKAPVQQLGEMARLAVLGQPVGAAELLGPRILVVGVVGFGSDRFRGVGSQGLHDVLGTLEVRPSRRLGRGAANAGATFLVQRRELASRAQASL